MPYNAYDLARQRAYHEYTRRYPYRSGLSGISLIGKGGGLAFGPDLPPAPAPAPPPPPPAAINLPIIGDVQPWLALALLAGGLWWWNSR